MSLVGPLVTPNKLETRFDRTDFAYRRARHPIVWALALLAGIGGAGIATHMIPSPF